MIEIREIDAAHQADIRLKNEPFALCGQLCPAYADGIWSYTVRAFAPENVGEMRFPDESYDYAAMRQNSVFLGAYDGERCIGLAILQDGFYKYQYLYDLKVCAAWRRQGVGAALIRRAKRLALEKGYRGLYLQAQDNNLPACLFYLREGFRIGGLDTEVYRGTSQEGKADIVFYLDA